MDNEKKGSTKTSNKISRGLYIGRFQPFHKGHLSIVRRALKEVSHLTIAIGSAQYNCTQKNPFTAEEREKIIQISLEADQIEQKFYSIIQANDIHDDERWPNHILSIVGDIEIIFTGDDGIVKRLFERYTKIPVKVFEEEIKIRATKIREMMIKDENWKELVSEEVAEYIEDIGGINRVKSLQ